jgi:2-polyprenyl-3-methyl-5-hydroxy-6-metoxy-1,4-benzoquinol methylase
VGCGNGHFLFSLYEAGYPTRFLQGVDNCRSAIDLCHATAQLKGIEGIDFMIEDVILGRDQQELVLEYSENYDLVMDKGVRCGSSDDYSLL